MFELTFNVVCLFLIPVHANATNKNQPNFMYGNTLAAGCRGGNCSIVKEGKSFAIWHKPYLNFILYEI